MGMLSTCINLGAMTPNPHLKISKNFDCCITP